MLAISDSDIRRKVSVKARHLKKVVKNNDNSNSLPNMQEDNETEVLDGSGVE